MRRRAGRRSARRARPRPGRAVPVSELAAKGSLRDAAVGCPERAQVGPLPWLSKSRRAGIWSAIRTPGSLTIDCRATRTYARPFGSKTILPVRFLGRHDLDVQLVELRLVDRARRAQHQVLVALGLGKSDHVPDVFGACKHHHDAIDSRRDASVWRDAELARIQDVAEPLADRCLRMAEDLEDSLL